MDSPLDPVCPTSWTSLVTALEGGRMVQVRMQRQGGGAPPLPTRREVLQLWQHDADFRDAFDRALADAPYTALFWETPPLAETTAELPFECVLVDAPALARMTPEPEVFARDVRRHAGPDGIGVFPNLRGDALLVVPDVDLPADVGAHLVAFARGAPRARRHALWRALGQAAAEQLSARPLWLSTSGLGVAWLHVRLDSRPKYVTHAAYRVWG